MSGRTDSDAAPAISRAAQADEPEDHGERGDQGEPDAHDEPDASGEPGDHDDRYDRDEHVGEARRARWTAAGAGGLLCLAGCAAALLRLTGPAPAVVPAAYALGAAVCALAAVLGSRGRTRRALWLLVAGTAVMAVGDQFD
ncbi:hypothetical protein [Streptomyces sp. DSM 118148]|uniref:hypothetical protein n=1 Tax=Streptomyces sp. DSM 118148 TaxID=3448667 RepID=UPI00403FD5FD